MLARDGRRLPPHRPRPRPGDGRDPRRAPRPSSPAPRSCFGVVFAVDILETGPAGRRHHRLGLRRRRDRRRLLRDRPLHPQPARRRPRPRHRAVVAAAAPHRRLPVARDGVRRGHPPGLRQPARRRQLRDDRPAPHAGCRARPRLRRLRGRAHRGRWPSGPRSRRSSSAASGCSGPWRSSPSSSGSRRWSSSRAACGSTPRCAPPRAPRSCASISIFSPLSPAKIESLAGALTTETAARRHGRRPRGRGLRPLPVIVERPGRGHPGRRAPALRGPRRVLRRDRPAARRPAHRDGHRRRGHRRSTAWPATTSSTRSAASTSRSPRPTTSSCAGWAGPEHRLLGVRRCRPAGRCTVLLPVRHPAAGLLPRVLVAVASRRPLLRPVRHPGRGGTRPGPVAPRPGPAPPRRAAIGGRRHRRRHGIRRPRRRGRRTTGDERALLRPRRLHERSRRPATTNRPASC